MHQSEISEHLESTTEEVLLSKNFLTFNGKRFHYIWLRDHCAYCALFFNLMLIAFLPILLRIGESFISPNATIFNRVWIASVVIGLWNGRLLLRTQLLQHSPFQVFSDTRKFILLLALTFCFLSYQLLGAWSLTQTSVANSEVLHSLTPLFTTLLGWILFRQYFDSLFLIGVAISIAGSISLGINDFYTIFDKLQGDGLALLSALFWALYLLIAEKLQKQLSVATIANWICFLGALILFPILLISHDQLFPSSIEGWLTVVSLGVSAAFIQGLTIYSLRFLSSGLVATILLINPLVTAVLAWMIFSETLSLLNWISLFTILSGIYLVTRSESKIKAEE